VKFTIRSVSDNYDPRKLQNPKKRPKIIFFKPGRTTRKKMARGGFAGHFLRFFAFFMKFFKFPPFSGIFLRFLTIFRAFLAFFDDF